MSFLGGAANRFIATYRAIKASVMGQVRAAEAIAGGTPSASPGGIKMTVRSDTSEAAGIVKASISVFFDRSIQATLLRDIGERGVDVVRDTLKPISRSGATAGSFKAKIDVSDSSVTIYSDEPQAAAIQTGIHHAGDAESMIAWLRTKNEFAGQSEKELARSAFLIRRSINRGDSPGSNSTLRQLAPSGERRFDYLGQASNQLAGEIGTMLDVMVTGIQ